MSKGKFYYNFQYIDSLNDNGKICMLNLECPVNPDVVNYSSHRKYILAKKQMCFLCFHSLKFISEFQRKIRYFMKKTNRNWMFLYKNLGKLKKINDMERAMEMGTYVGGNYNFQPDDLPTCLE